MTSDTKNKALYLLSMLLVLAAAVLFISLRLRRPHAVEADLPALGAELTAAGLTEHTVFGSEAALKRHFDLLPASFAEMLYFSPETFMDIDEILLIKTADSSQAAAIRAAMEKRIETQKKTFENYGTDQFSLMQEAVIYENERYLCFASGHHAAEALSLIRSRIEE